VLKELYDEEITEDEFAALVEKPPNDLGITEIRRMMIRLRQVDREREKLTELRNAVVAPYNERIARYNSDEQVIRARLQAFVEAYGNAAFPDVGTAYLQTQKAKVDVVDASKAKKWATDNGFVKEEADVTAAKNSLRDAGEVPPEESGMEWVPERAVLAIRDAG
jgi:hypothetical protein